ncbi:helix-turn-helix transcriptional regulator [Streptomyces malaysiensis subsp. malaysiensis]|uniref:Helix-turn-helix domain-containing protein n=1 Tax=Streptomyces malaysiensis TaxID=92644 RepID=A0ABX6W0X6_STRMQ|nr:MULTISPECIES: helix-turn-helix domain-containing protein [Streptomyces]QPI55153.1 helix-turn-helix domain-containing protein [Streptomyces solisilvae]UHH16587.1 helix-turn-helix domain-containing protein [Streptomyces sp. HNM0561]
MNLSELGAFLKSRRDRIRPADVGLPAGPRRRVPGLRREEVAQLTGASVDYYIELERGGGAQPSEQMLAALARALRLNRDERDHLFALAGRPLPPSDSPAGHVHPGMLDLLHRMDSTPAQVVTDLRITLVQNRLANALLGPPPATAGWTASFLYRWFTDPAVRAIYPPEDHDHHTHSFVADLRAATARRGGHDPEATALIAELSALSPEFADEWARHDVEFRRSDRKRLIHPELGLLEVNCLNLYSEDGRQRLLWFTPAVGTDSVAKLEMLAVLGTQNFAP